MGAKPGIKSYPTFGWTLSKWKLFTDRFLAVVLLLKPHYHLPRKPQTLERHSNANIFIFSTSLFAIAGGTASTVVKNIRTHKMGGWVGSPLQVV